MCQSQPLTGKHVGKVVRCVRGADTPPYIAFGCIARSSRLSAWQAPPPPMPTSRRWERLCATGTLTAPWPPLPPRHPAGTSSVWPNECPKPLKLSCLHPCGCMQAASTWQVRPTISPSHSTDFAAHGLHTECTRPTPMRCTYPNHIKTVAVEMMIVPPLHLLHVLLSRWVCTGGKRADCEANGRRQHGPAIAA